MSGKDILEIGCGTGYGSSYLMHKGAKKVLGIDIADGAIDLAKAHFERPGLKYTEMNGERLSLPENSFDIVLSFGVIDHLENPKLFLSECNRVLKDGGLFVCSVMNREFTTPYPFKKPIDTGHKTEFNPQELYLLMAKHFSHIIETRGFTYMSRRWWQARFIATYILRIPRLEFIGSKVARMVFRSTYRLVTYSEDTVDRNFASNNNWGIIDPASSSDNVSFMILASKSSQMPQGKD